MKITEFVSSKEEVLTIVQDLLLRARSEGADQVSLDQLTNEFDGSLSKEMLASLISRNRNSMKGIVGQVTDTSVEFAKDRQERAEEKSVKQLKSIALGQAKKGLK